MGVRRAPLDLLEGRQNPKRPLRTFVPSPRWCPIASHVNVDFSPTPSLVMDARLQKATLTLRTKHKPKPSPPPTPAPPQMPLCYHPSLEYQLEGLVRSNAFHVDALFPGAASSTGRRSAIVSSLRAAGITVQVSDSGL